MSWKYLVIAVARIFERQVSIQFDVTADSVGEAESIAKGLMAKWFDLDILEIRRI